MKRKVLLLAISLAFAFNMTGCSLNTKAKNAETNYFSINIDGEKEYREEKNEDVIKVSESAKDFVYAYDNVDYRNDSYLKEMDYYTSEVKERKEGNGYREYLEEYMTTYELVKEVSDFKIEEIEFYKNNGVERAEATCIFNAEIKNYAEEYVEELRKGLNTPYKLRYKIQFEKEDNNWFVSEIVTKEYADE